MARRSDAQIGRQVSESQEKIFSWRERAISRVEVLPPPLVPEMPKKAGVLQSTVPADEGPSGYRDPREDTHLEGWRAHLGGATWVRVSSVVGSVGGFIGSNQKNL